MLFKKRKNLKIIFYEFIFPNQLVFIYICLRLINVRKNNNNNNNKK